MIARGPGTFSKSADNSAASIGEDVKQVPEFEDKMVENLQSAGLTVGQDGGTAEASRRQAETGLDINCASAEELERVTQIGGQRARNLVEARIGWVV